MARYPLSAVGRDVEVTLLVNDQPQRLYRRADPDSSAPGAVSHADRVNGSV